MPCLCVLIASDEIKKKTAEFGEKEAWKWMNNAPVHTSVIVMAKNQ